MITDLQIEIRKLSPFRSAPLCILSRALFLQLPWFLMWYVAVRFVMAPPRIGGGIKWCFCLTSVAYIGPKSRTERPRKTKIGTEVAQVTRDSDITFKVKRSKSPGRYAHCGLNAWGRSSGDRDNVWAWETTATLRLLGGARGAWGAHGGGGGGGRRAGHIVSPRAQLVFITLGKTLAFVKKILCKKSKMFRKRAIEQCTLLFWLRKSV